jgi:hypothetical protein
VASFSPCSQNLPMCFRSSRRQRSAASAVSYSLVRPCSRFAGSTLVVFGLSLSSGKRLVVSEAWE